MGWTEYTATEFKNGRVDRKAECDKIFNWSDDNITSSKVLKSSMVGTTYYAAIEYSKGDYKTVYAVVCLTSVRERYLFAYKDMSEDMGPYQYDCPKSIIDLLPPTDNEWANEWRQKCLAKKKETTLAKLPLGTQIEVTMPFDTSHYRNGEKVILTKEKGYKQAHWLANGYIRFTRNLMKQLYELGVVKVLETA